MLRACPAAVAADVSGCIPAAISATLATMTCTARTMRWIRGIAMLSILLALAPCSAPVRAEASAGIDGAAVGRGQSFWLSLANDCTVPAGESAVDLVREAIGQLGSPDPFWRDDIGYGVVVSCVYQKKLLDAGQRREIIATLAGHLRRGIGEAGTDTVLLRSFAALDLSILAALELQDPVLDDAGYRSLLDDALAYLRDERDLRGIDPRVGWIHATAHAADLLKFLARDPRFTPADQARLLDATWLRMTAPGTPVLSHAEDERLAAALMSVMRRPDFDPASLDPWLAGFVAIEKRVWQQSPPEAAALDAAQNARNLLRSLHLLLSMPQPDPSPGQLAARGKALATLQQIRR